MHWRRRAARPVCTSVTPDIVMGKRAASSPPPPRSPSITFEHQRRGRACRVFTSRGGRVNRAPQNWGEGFGKRAPLISHYEVWHQRRRKLF